jgi:hypothetical protein
LDGPDGKRPTIVITLNPNAVAVPVQQAARTASQVIAECLTSLADRELDEPTMPGQFIQYQFGGPSLTSDQRRTIYQNWLLAKGFQDLVRGVRETLEEACSYLHMIKQRGPVQLHKLAADREKARMAAAKLGFPQLMAKVTAGLVEPIAFGDGILSMQKVRNCLEHRGGIVGPEDLDKGKSAVALYIPRREIFYMRKGEEIEVVPDEPVNAEDGEPEVQLLIRFVVRTHQYPLGERISFSAAQFGEIAAACDHFGVDLANKLPRVQT